MPWNFQILLCISLSCLTSEIHCYDISSCALSKKSNCDPGGGMILGQDAFTVTIVLDNSGVVGPSAAEFSLRKRGDINFSPVCIVTLGNMCAGIPNLDCNCIQNTNGYTTYFNKSAAKDYDTADIKLSWGTEECITPLEVVKDLKTVDCPPESGKCELELPQPGPIQYCCSSILSPVQTSISIDSKTYTGDNCTNLNASEAESGQYYTFRSTVCGSEVYLSSCNRTTENDMSDQGCDTTCIIIIVVVVVVCGLVAVGAIYFYRRRHGKITTCVIKIKVSATLMEVETMVIKEAGRQGHRLPNCEKVIKYKGKEQVNKNTKLEDLVLVHVGVTVKVTVNVCRDGTLVLDEIVSIAVLEIPVKASESLNQLQDVVKTDVSTKHPDTELGILIFLLDGKKLNDMSIKLGILFTGLKDGMILTVIVHLDGSCKCEIKGPEPRGSSADSNFKKRPVSPPSLRYNEENKHTSEVETPREDKPRKKKKKRRGKTSPQGDNNGNDYTDAPSGTFENVQKSSKYDDEKPNDLDHGDYQHDSDEISRPLPKRSANNQSKDGNRTMQTSGFNVQQSPQDSRPTSIEMTSAPRRLPKLTKKPK